MPVDFSKEVLIDLQLSQVSAREQTGLRNSFLNPSKTFDTAHSSQHLTPLPCNRVSTKLESPFLQLCASNEQPPTPFSSCAICQCSFPWPQSRFEHGITDHPQRLSDLPASEEHLNRDHVALVTCHCSIYQFAQKLFLLTLSRSCLSDTQSLQDIQLCQLQALLSPLLSTTPPRGPCPVTCQCWSAS